MSMKSANKLISAISTNDENRDKIFKNAILEHASGQLEATRSHLGESLLKMESKTSNKHSEIVYCIGEDIVRFPAIDVDRNPIHHEMYEEYNTSSMYARVDHSQKIVGILPSKDLGDEYGTIFESFLSTLKETFGDYTFYGRSEESENFDILSESWIVTAQIV